MPVRAATNWKPPAICLVVGLTLIAVPDPITSSIRSHVIDLARPGQQAVAELVVRLENWHPLERTASVTHDPQRDLEAARLEIRRLRIANSRLIERSSDVRTGSPRPPLITTDLVPARVLGHETIAAWQAGRILDRGHGLTVDSLVVEPGHATLDLGIDSGLARGQPAYAGRRVAGRISRVGRWTSTLQPLTDTRFRGLARLARRGRDRPVFAARGMLEGSGDGFCQLTLVPATEVVARNDLVYTDGRDQPGGLFGIQANHGYGHEHGGQLLDGPVARRGALDELLDVCSPQLLARSFARDDFDRRHHHRPDTHHPACPVDRRRWQRSDIIDPRVVEGELLVDLYRQVAHGRNSEVDTLVLTSAAGKNILI